jgi:cytochrome c-type biogenesis protein CcmE
MTTARTRRRAALALAVTAATTTGVLIVAGLQGTLLYYRTPADILAAPPSPGTRIRLEGTVVAGSVHAAGPRTTFELSDEHASMRVITSDTPPAAFRTGEQAVVEGHLGSDGVFAADKVIAKHSNEYRAGTR